MRTNVMLHVAGADYYGPDGDGRRMTTTVQSMFTDADPEDSDADVLLTDAIVQQRQPIATATVDAMGVVTIMGESMGTATITVTATDSMGATAMQEIIAVTVEAANSDPMAMGTIDGGNDNGRRDVRGDHPG